MKSTEMKLPELHKLHAEWVSKLSFYKDEMHSLQQRNEEIAKQNNRAELLAQVEHFQNQFIIQRNEIDILMHDIKMEESVIQQNFSDNPTAWDHRKAKLSQLHERIEIFEKLFSELTNDVRVFAAKHL